MTIPNSRPLDVIGMTIDDLFAEAKNFLDGQPIETEEQASAVGKLRDMIRDAEKAATAAKKAERDPHAEQVKAVDAAWKPLLEKAGLAKDTCNEALAPFLRAKQARQEAEAAAARAEAQRLANEAQAARQATPASDLEGRSAAERMLKAAQDAGRAAARLERAKPQVAGASRAVGLRSSFTAELADASAALRHYREHQPELLKAWLTEQAQRDVNAGARAIPGFIINEERRAA